MNRVKKCFDSLVEKYVIRLMCIYDVWRVNISVLCLRLLEIAILSQTAVVARWIVTSGWSWSWPLWPATGFRGSLSAGWCLVHLIDDNIQSQKLFVGTVNHLILETTIQLHTESYIWDASAQFTKFHFLGLNLRLSHPCNSLEWWVYSYWHCLCLWTALSYKGKQGHKNLSSLFSRHVFHTNEGTGESDE